MDILQYALARKMGVGKLPFGETKEVVEILPETTSAVTEEGSTSAMTAAAKMIVGETYIVNYNGVEYETKLVSIEIDEGYSLTFFGNASMFDAADTGEPFMGSYVEEVDVVSFVPLDGATEVTASIRQEQTTIVPLPAKYLPKGVPYAGDAEVPFNFTFDGDTTGKEVIEVYEGVGYVKVADIVLTRDDLTNAVMTMMSADEEIIYEFDLESIIDVNGDGSIFGGGEYVLAVQRDSEMSGLAFAPGLYFINYPGVYLVKSLIKEGATVTEEVINKLDGRCLPTDATELYLTSSGGKKFKITVSDDGALSAAEVTE